MIRFAAFLLCLSTACGVDFGKVSVAGKWVTVCRVDLNKEQLQLFLRDDSGLPLKSFDSINRWLQPQGRKLVFAMNAGMYHGNLAPVGLCVQNGKQLAPINLAKGDGNFFLKPNGVFLVAKSGACVIDSAEYSMQREPTLLATQSGPLLVRANKIHAAFNPNSESRLIRNGVGVASPNVVCFAISEEPVNFYEFAILFRDVLHCPNALFLDGTVSSLYAPTLKRNDRKIDLGSIIGIAEEIPIAIAEPGKPGFVRSPFSPGILDVRGLPSGTEIKDQTGKVFRIP